MDLPLQGVKVVEVAMWVAGPSTTAVLGDWGADVIKLEDPTTGDPIRGFVTRTMRDPIARMKLDYATLSARNPRLIYASINGYGHRGPDRNRPAYDYAAAWARS